MLSRFSFSLSVLLGAVLFSAIFGGGMDVLGRGILFACAALFVILEPIRWPGEKEQQIFYGGALLFALAIIFSLPFSFDRYHTLQDLFLFLISLLICASLISLPKHWSGEKPFFWALLFGTFLFALYGLYIFIGAAPLFRLGSVFYQQNAFAGFLLPSMFFLAGLLFYEFPRKSSWWVLPLAVFFTSIFILTFARGAGLAFFGALGISGILFGWSRRTWIKNIGIVLFVLVLGGVLAFGIFHFKNQPAVSEGGTAISSPVAFFDYETKNENGLVARFVYLEESLRVFLHHPITGVGWGSFGDALMHHREDIRNYTTDPHNLIARGFVELGVVGGSVLVGLLLFIVFILGRVGSQIRQNAKPTSMMSFVLVGSVLSLLFQNMVNADWLFPTDLFLFWVLVGLLMRRGMRSFDSRALPRFLSVSILVILLALVIFAGARVFAEQHSLQSKAFSKENDFSMAFRESEHAVRFDSLNPLYRRDLALLALTRASAQEEGERALYLQIASEHIAQGLLLRPHDPYLLFLQARVSLLSGNVERAEKELLLAIQEDRFTLFPAYRELADLYFSQKRYEPAREFLSSVVAEYPPSVFTSIAWINPYKDETRKDVADLWLRLGLAEIGLHNSEVAGKAFTQGREFSPDNPLLARSEECLARGFSSYERFRSCFSGLQ